MRILAGGNPKQKHLFPTRRTEENSLLGARGFRLCRDRLAIRGQVLEEFPEDFHLVQTRKKEEFPVVINSFQNQQGKSNTICKWKRNCVQQSQAKRGYPDILRMDDIRSHDPRKPGF